MSDGNQDVIFVPQKKPKPNRYMDMCIYPWCKMVINSLRMLGMGFCGKSVKTVLEQSLYVRAVWKIKKLNVHLFGEFVQNVVIVHCYQI